MNKNLQLLIFGVLSTRLGSIIFTTTLAWWVTSTTGDSKYFGIISFFSTIPLILFSLFSGGLVDVYNKKKVLIYTDLLNTILCGLMALVTHLGYLNIYFLVVVSFFLGATNTLFSPTLKAIIPSLFSKEALEGINSKIAIVSQTTKIAGPFISGILIGLGKVDIMEIFILNGLSFFISALSEMFIDYKVDIKVGKKNVFQNIKKGIKYIKIKIDILILLIFSGLLNIFFSGYNILLPLYLHKYFPKFDGLYGHTLSIEAVGGILGAFYLTKSKKVHGYNTVYFNVFIIGISLWLLQYFHNMLVLAISIGSFGFFLGMYNINIVTYIQKHALNHYHGRVFSLMYFLALLLMPFADLIFGYLGVHIIDYLFLIIGFAVCLLAVVFYLIHRHMRSHTANI